MKLKNSNQSRQDLLTVKTILYLLTIFILLFSVNGNVVLANQINTSKMQFLNPQDIVDNKVQTQAILFNNYLPLILNGLPVPSELNKNAPANGSTGVSLSPVLSWTASANATEYEYCYDTTPDGECSNWISTGTDNYAGLFGLQQGATYYWQARAWNGTVGPIYADGTANSFWSFTTLIILPGAFNKNAPVPGSTEVSLSPVISWNPSTNATRYEYCYDTTYDGACSNWVSTGTNTYAGLWSLQQGTTYYWQVRSWNGTYGPTYANGSSGAYWGFTTVVMNPGAFNKNAPANGATGVSLSPVLSWNPSTNATRYEYCYDTSNDGSCSNWISTGTNTYAGLSGLQQVTSYYWQVRSWNGTYGPTYANGNASAHWGFTTVIMSPGAFNKYAPANGSTDISLSPVLSWTASTNATRYEYCYDTTNDSACSNWISADGNTYVGLSGLQRNTIYYWQVRSWNGTAGPTYANGSNANYWSFLTIPPEGGFWIYPNYIIYEDYGYGHFIGEILNNTTQNAELIGININLWDSSGNFVGKDYGYVSLWLLSAGEKTCFEIWFEYPENFAYLTIDSISYWETEDDRLNISTSNVSGSYNGDYYRIIGFLTNNENISVKANVVDTVYSTTGHVAACSVSYVDPILAPGATNSFDDNYITVPLGLIANNFKVQTDGYESQSLNSEDPEAPPLKFHDPSIYWLTDLSPE